MLKAVDESKEIFISGTKIPLVLENIVINIDSPISLDLINWENAGLRIGVFVEGLGMGYFNDQPYSDRETALKEYQHVLAQVQQGNYSLELCSKGGLKLSLIDSK